jgi:hypothetical protein
MAEPNPDDGLVPDILELYKRNPTEWQREARGRMEANATAQKLEELESSLDRESARGNNEYENVAAGNGGRDARDANPDNCAEPSQRGSRGARTVAEVDNRQNGRQHKKSNLCSRK